MAKKAAVDPRRAHAPGWLVGVATLLVAACQPPSDGLDVSFSSTLGEDCALQMLSSDRVSDECEELVRDNPDAAQELEALQQAILEAQRQSLVDRAHHRVGEPTHGEAYVVLCFEEESAFAFDGLPDEAEPLLEGCRRLSLEWGGEYDVVVDNMLRRYPGEFVGLWLGWIPSDYEGSPEEFFDSQPADVQAEILERIRFAAGARSIAAFLLEFDHFTAEAVKYAIEQVIYDRAVYDGVVEGIIDYVHRCETTGSCCADWDLICHVAERFVEEQRVRVSAGIMIARGLFTDAENLSFWDTVAASLLVVAPSLGYASHACADGVSVECGFEVFGATTELAVPLRAALRGTRALTASRAAGGPVGMRPGTLADDLLLRPCRVSQSRLHGGSGGCGVTIMDLIQSFARNPGRPGPQGWYIARSVVEEGKDWSTALARMRDFSRLTRDEQITVLRAFAAVPRHAEAIPEWMRPARQLLDHHSGVAPLTDEALDSAETLFSIGWGQEVGRQADWLEDMVSALRQGYTPPG